MVSIERRVSQFSTICAKIGALNLVVDKVTVLLGTNYIVYQYTFVATRVHYSCTMSCTSRSKFSLLVLLKVLR